MRHRILYWTVIFRVVLKIKSNHRDSQLNLMLQGLKKNLIKTTFNFLVFGHLNVDFGVLVCFVTLNRDLGVFGCFVTPIHESNPAIQYGGKRIKTVFQKFS